MDQQQGWTVEAIQRLTEMARERTPVATMSLALRRPTEAVRAKLGEPGIAPAEAWVKKAKAAPPRWPVVPGQRGGERRGTPLTS